MGDDIDEAYDEGAEDEPAVQEDNRPRTDIAPLITDSLIAEINDKNWKVRALWSFMVFLIFISLILWPVAISDL